MPLPKLPTRPAAILDLTAVELRVKTIAREPEEIQPELEGLRGTQPFGQTTPTHTQHPASSAHLNAVLPLPNPPAIATRSLLRDTHARAGGTSTSVLAKKGRATGSPGASRGTKRTGSKPSATGVSKLFVLDTNVLLHDPSSLFRFEEHDVFLPMMTLEELDHQKKGMTEVARNARQVSRSLDTLVGDNTKLDEGLPLDGLGHKDATGRLYFQTKAMSGTLPPDLPMGKADNQILGVVEALRKEYAPREVVLVSKDINMRVKARALGLATDDYQNDKTLDDGDLLYSGVLALPNDFWTRQSKTIESWQQGSYNFYRITGPIVTSLLINQFVFFEAPGEPPLYARVTEIRAKTAVLKTLKDFNRAKLCHEFADGPGS